MCVLRCDIMGSFYSKRQGAQFSHYYINGLGEILSFKSFKWGSLLGALSVCSKQRILFGVSSAVYGILLHSQVCCSFTQYNLEDRMLRLGSNPILHSGG